MGQFKPQGLPFLRFRRHCRKSEEDEELPDPMEWTEEESQRRRTDEVGAVVPEAARCRMGTVVGYRQFERKKDEMKERGDTRKTRYKKRNYNSCI